MRFDGCRDVRKALQHRSVEADQWDPNRVCQGDILAVVCGARGGGDAVDHLRILDHELAALNEGGSDFDVVDDVAFAQQPPP